MFRRKSFYLLLVLLLLLFSIPVIEYVAKWSPTTTLVQIVGFAITLIGIFGGAYFELDRLQEQTKQERQKENRQIRLLTLAEIEKWVDDVDDIFNKLDVLVKLSPKDKTNDKFIFEKEKTKFIAEKSVYLNNRWFITITKTADLLGFKKNEVNIEDLSSEKQSLFENMVKLGMGLEKSRKMLERGNSVPIIDDEYKYALIEAKRLIDKIRLTME